MGLQNARVATQERRGLIQMTDDIQFTMTFESNNDDGSANYKLDLNEYTTSKLVEIGVIALLKENIALEKAKRESLYNRAKSFLRNHVNVKA